MVKAAMMKTKNGGSYNQEVKPRIQSITISYMKQDLHGFEDYEDLVWFLLTDQVATFITTTTAKDPHEIKGYSTSHPSTNVRALKRHQEIHENML